MSYLFGKPALGVQHAQRNFVYQTRDGLETGKEERDQQCTVLSNVALNQKSEDYFY